MTEGKQGIGAYRVSLKKVFKTEAGERTPRRRLEPITEEVNSH
jgi:hypothetical protein